MPLSKELLPQVQSLLKPLGRLDDVVALSVMELCDADVAFRHSLLVGEYCSDAQAFFQVVFALQEL